MRTFGIVAAILAGTTLVVVGCGSDDRPPTSSLLGDAGPGSTTDATTTTESGADAASITPRDDLCKNLTLGGSPIEELAYAQTPPPALGGTIEQGTYDLQEAAAYNATIDNDGGENQNVQVSGNIVQSTLIVSEFGLQFYTSKGMGLVDEDAGLSAPVATGYLYRTDGTNILGTLVCPGTAAPAAMAYSAVGNGLAVFTDANHRLTYVRR